MAEGEPFEIRRMRVAVRADVFAVRAAPVKIEAVVADVGKHAVEHHMHAQLFCVFTETNERLLVAEHRIDPAVIAGVVFMVGARAENRVEIQHAHAEPFKIRQFLAHAFQIAAEKIVGKIVAVFRDVEKRHLIPLVVQDDVLPVLGVHQRVRALAAAEPVHHDLIHHALAHPRGRIVGRVIDRDLKALLAAHHAFAASGMVVRRAKHHAPFSCLALKPIPQQIGRVAHTDLRFINRLSVPHAERTHGIAAFRPIPDTQKKFERRLIAFCGHTQPNLTARRNRALRLAVKRAEGMMFQNHVRETLRLFKIAPRRFRAGTSYFSF